MVIAVRMLSIPKDANTSKANCTVVATSSTLD
jgi:hypothetical protein